MRGRQERRWVWRQPLVAVAFGRCGPGRRARRPAALGARRRRRRRLDPRLSGLEPEPPSRPGAALCRLSRRDLPPGRPRCRARHRLRRPADRDRPRPRRGVPGRFGRQRRARGHGQSRLPARARAAGPLPLPARAGRPGARRVAGGARRDLDRLRQLALPGDHHQPGALLSRCGRSPSTTSGWSRA